MKRVFFLTLVSILVSGLLVVVYTPLSASANPSAYKWPTNLVFLGPKVEEARYQQLLSWAPLLEKSTGTRVRLMSEESLATKTRWMKQGRYPFNSEGGGAFALTVQAKRQYAAKDLGPVPWRALWNMTTGSLGFVVQADSEIKTIDDIKPGLKIGIPGGMTGLSESWDGFLAWNNLKQADMKVIPFGSWPSASKALIDGKVDIAYVSAASPYMMEIASGPHGVRFLEMNPKKDPEGARRFLNVKPSLGFGPCSIGIKEAIGVTMLAIPTPMYTIPETDTGLVYNLVKWWGENYDLYKDKHPQNVDMRKEAQRVFLDQTFLPIHDGAIKYFKEIGMWTPEHDKAQQENIALQNRYLKAWEAALAEAKKQGITIDPNNKQWKDLWESYKEDIPPLKTRI
jgi:TRAP transporter TAXI family solute receptor